MAPHIDPALERLCRRQLAVRETILDDRREKSDAFAPYTGTGESLGAGTIYNTVGQAYLMTATLAMSHHPLVERIVEDHLAHRERPFDATPLVDAKVLKGMRVLELGCGLLPAYARCSRALGAEVYTTDVEPADQFAGHQDVREADANFHIRVDMRDPSVPDTIFRCIKTPVDLVAYSILCPTPLQCYLNEPDDNHVRAIAYRVLKDDGVVFSDYLNFQSRDAMKPKVD